MKCANLRNAFAVIMVLGALIGMTAPAIAQAPTASPTVPAAIPPLTEVSPLNVPSASPLASENDIDAAANASTEDEDDAPVPALVRDMPAAGNLATGGLRPMNATAGAGATPTGAAIPSAVTDVVSDLRRAEKSVSLEDVARAQDALARLDLLLDIERKINEIEKTREDRKNIGKSMSRDGGSMGRVPASALSLPMGGSGATRPVSTFRPASVSSAPSMPAPAPVASRDTYKVDQISGSNGRYRAVLVDTGGKKTTVSEGEKLGAYTVSKISATGVTLADGKDRKVLNVESGGIPMVVRN